MTSASYSIPLPRGNFSLSNPRMSSMTTRRSINMRPISSATTIIDGSEEVRELRKKPAGGWHTRKSGVQHHHNMEPMREEADESSGSDAESFESLSSRAKFMSELLSDSDSSIDGRPSFDGAHTATTVSTFDSPRTPTTPAPEYTDTGFPLVEIADEKSPRSSYDVSPTFAQRMKEISTVGPRGPHLFRFSDGLNAGMHIQIPPPNIVLPPTPSASNASRSPVEPLSPIAMVEEPTRPVAPAPLTPPTEDQMHARMSPRSEMSHAASEYDLEEVRSWTPAQVAVWMAALGFEPELVEKFVKNDITGAILVDLKWEDLKELDIQSFGKRIELWTEIHHLRARTYPTPDLPGGEFVRSSSRLSRKTSISSKSSRAPNGRQKVVREVGEVRPEAGVKALPDLPTLLHRRLSPNEKAISEGEEEASEVSEATRKDVRPVIRARARKTSVRIPRRQISVDSIIIASEDGEEEYARQLRAMPSVDDVAEEEHLIIRPRRTRSRRRPAKERDAGVDPGDSVSARGSSRKHKCKKHGHHHHRSAEGEARREGKPHRCSKGERCPRFGKISRSSHGSSTKRSRSPSPPRTGTILIATTPSIADPSSIPRLSALDGAGLGSPRPQSYSNGSAIASSDVLGPVHAQEVRLQESALRDIQRVDPLENVRQFLTHQHLQHLEERRGSPPPVPAKTREEMVRARSTLPPPPASSPAPVPRSQTRTAPPVAPQQQHAPQSQSQSQSQSQNQSQTRAVPIPPVPAAATYPTPTPTPSPPRAQTPSFGLRSQGMERAAPPHLNFSTPSRTRTPSRYMTTTPFSEADVPVPCATPVDYRLQSQSVPPDLHYRRYPTPTLQTLTHGSGTGARRGTQWPQALQMSAVDESAEWEAVDEENVKMAPSPNVRTHSGWMKKRRTNWFRHEWPDYHFVLKGTRLGYAKDVATGQVGTIDMDHYQVACSNSGSTKLSAAFKAGRIFGKKKDGNGGTYFFQLVPASGLDRKTKACGKVHYFSVGSREERIDWMRELMLAKAIKQKKQGFEVEVNGRRV